VQSALGVPLNWTMSSDLVGNEFSLTGDFVRQAFLADLGYLLDQGVRVTLYHGDADYICNWFGGEAVSLAVDWNGKQRFNNAGYTDFIASNATYGQVRQAGNLAFVRVYRSGHLVPYYQPILALNMFARTISGLDVATGQHVVTPLYSSVGPSNSTYREDQETGSNA